MTRHKTRHRGIYYRNGSDDPSALPRRYIVWYSDSDGKGRTETLPLGSTEKDALTRQAELRGKIAKGARVAPSKLTLEQFSKQWLEEQEGRKAPATIRSYRFVLNHLRPLKRRKLHELTVDDVARLVADMQRQGYKAWSIRRVLSGLSEIMSVAVRRGHCAANPVGSLHRSERPKGDQRRMRVLDREEIEVLLESVLPAWRPLTTTLVFTGMRISEALSIVWDDVDFESGLITVRESKTDAGRGRRIVLIPSLAAVLRRHKLASGHSGPEDFVFGTKDGKQLDRGNVYHSVMKRGRVEERLGALTLHELRHTFASILIGQGFDVTFVADQLGHASPSTTLTTYAKLFDPAARRDEARERLQVAFGGLVGK